MKHMAALLLACHVATTFAAPPLGRLFFTPEQRAALDELRTHRPQRTVSVAAPAEAPPPALVTYSGLVQRSDGHSTVWINHRPVYDRIDDSSAATARVEDDGTARIVMPQQPGRVRLKVGQTAELATGRIAESYARRPRTPQPKAAPPNRAEPVLRLRRKHDYDRDLGSDSAP